MTTVRDERAGAADDAQASAPSRLRWLFPALGIVAFLLLGGPLGGMGSNLSTVQKNDSAQYLPRGASPVKGSARRR